MCFCFVGGMPDAAQIYAVQRALMVQSLGRKRSKRSKRGDRLCSSVPAPLDDNNPFSRAKNKVRRGVICAHMCSTLNSKTGQE